MGLAAEVGGIVDRRLAEAAYPYVLWMSPTAKPGGTSGRFPRVVIATG
jgi:hypothetical protein